jgi:hypothetical protein
MLPPERRREIAEPLGISEQYLYQILRGDGVASPALRDLRPDDWQDIWPELAESEAKKPPALDHQAPAAINSEAKEVAHA